MANNGHSHALKRQIAKQSECIEELGLELGNLAEQVANLQNIIVTLKTPSILWRDGFPLTVERIQIMEDGTPRILPPSPIDTCELESTKVFGKSNGKKLETTTTEIFEVAANNAS